MLACHPVGVPLFLLFLMLCLLFGALFCGELETLPSLPNQPLSLSTFQLLSRCSATGNICNAARLIRSRMVARLFSLRSRFLMSICEIATSLESRRKKGVFLVDALGG